MKHPIFLPLYAAITLLPLVFSHYALALESPDLSLTANSRNDIDYRTRSLALGSSAITQAGKFDCLASTESGDTRIDAFNEIFGLDSVLQAEWLDYSASRLKCGYGMAIDIADGKLTAGLGLDSYNGSTDLVAGGKKNDIDGLGLLLAYKVPGQKHRLKVINKDMVFLTKHTASYGDYDSNTRLKLTEFDYTVQIQAAYFSLHQTRGEKSNRYTTTLLADNTFNYSLSQLSAGPVFRLSNNARLSIAPMLVAGSDRGSFNSLKTRTEFNGIEGRYKTDAYSITFKANRFDGRGSRSYQPATDELLENKNSRQFSLKAEFTSWSVEISNNRFTHTGEVAVTGPVYIAILGGTGPFINRRDEDKWQSMISYQYNDAMRLNFKLYYTQRSDRQYSFPVHDYTETGGLASMTYKF